MLLLLLIASVVVLWVKEVEGEVSDADLYSQIVLNGNGKLEVWVMAFGATVTHVFYPDVSGTLRDIVLGFDDPESYANYLQHPYFGAIVGRYANRIANGSFTLNGRVYHTPLNEKTDTLHGGDIGYDSRVWDVVFQNTSSVKFRLYDHHLVESFPGDLSVTVQYSVIKDMLEIDFHATTETQTIINLASHIYWNLNGFAQNRETILDHLLQIEANQYTPVDSTLIPTGEIASVSTAYWLNFTSPKLIGKDIAHGTVTPNGGYDNNFVLNPHSLDQPVATVYAPFTSIQMQLFTTQPGIQFYSSNSLDGTIVRKRDQLFFGVNGYYQRYSGIALETQHYPDSIHHDEWPTTVLNNGEAFHEVTRLKFSVV